MVDLKRDPTIAYDEAASNQARIFVDGGFPTQIEGTSASVIAKHTVKD
jgi:hypothetical protein